MENDNQMIIENEETVVTTGRNEGPPQKLTKKLDPIIKPPTLLTPTPKGLDPDHNYGAGPSYGGGNPERNEPERGRTQQKTGEKRERRSQAPTRQTPEDIKKNVGEMIKGLANFFNQIMTQLGYITPNERRLIQNSRAVEKMLLSATDTKKTDYLISKARKDAQEGKDVSTNNPDTTGAVFYKEYKEGNLIWYKAQKETMGKEAIRSLYRAAMKGEGFNGLNHIMVGHSQENDTCFQRSKAMKSVGLDTSLISTFAGSTLPRRAGQTGTAIKGTGTLIAEAIRFIKRMMNERSLKRDTSAMNAYGKILANLKLKCPTNQQKELVAQVISSKNPGQAEIEDLILLARSCLIMRGSVTSKASFPLCMYAEALQHDWIGEGYSMVGHEAFYLYNRCTVVSIIRPGEDAQDKSQLFLMSCFGAAYEDLRVLSAMVETIDFKPRSMLQSKGFHVPVKEQSDKMGAAIMRMKFSMWAPLTKSGGNEATSNGTSGQVAVQPTFSVERPIAISKTAIRKMMSVNVEGRSGDVKEALLNTMEANLSRKTIGEAFTGKSFYKIGDEKKTTPIKPTLKQGIPSFFFGRDTAEDYDDIKST
uniref:NP n=1 Tax=Wuhan spiny eel influenza virus TaxID=2116483 RepID=A0A2P1GNS3_9ORTO|nr:NP [Wuhan spiny eel influenza virus]